MYNILHCKHLLIAGSFECLVVPVAHMVPFRMAATPLLRSSAVVPRTRSIRPLVPSEGAFALGAEGVPWDEASS
jgi:hypothetical protein